MTKPTANLRLFVAAYPPPDLAHALVSSLANLDLPPHQPTRPDQVHMTLQFIGDTPAADVPDVLESVRRATGGLAPFGLAVEDLITLPKKGPARLIAARTDAPSTLLELQRRLVLRLANVTRDKANDRFLPHMTLLRFRAPTPLGRLPENPGFRSAGGPFAVTQIRVMRSTLHPTGAEHRLVEAVELAAR